MTTEVRSQAFAYAMDSIDMEIRVPKTLIMYVLALLLIPSYTGVYMKPKVKTAGHLVLRSGPSSQAKVLVAKAFSIKASAVQAS